MSPDELTVWRRSFGMDVWVVGTSDGEPAVFAIDDAGAPGALAFLDADVAAASVPEDATLSRTTLRSMLRAAPAALTIVLQRGQDEEAVIPPDEIDQILGVPRASAPLLSPPELAVSSSVLASVTDGRIVPDPNGEAVGSIVRGAVEAGPVVLACGPTPPLELDTARAEALERAAAPSAPGFDIAIGVPRPELHPAVTGFVDASTGPVAEVLGVIVECAAR